MNSPVTDYALAFSYAKEALQFVGRFQTPPTPKVYEVWYRYVEGKNEDIRNQLDHAIKETNSVSTEFLEGIFDQFCSATNDLGGQVGVELTQELAEFGSLIHSQISAGNEFNSSINSASQTLQKHSESSAEVKACVEKLLESNQRMQNQFQITNQRLIESQSHVESLRKHLDASQRTIMTDPLTGVGNRRFFNHVMDQIIGHASADPLNRFLLLIDLDRFKQINDTFGHSVGDEVLKYVANQCLRQGQQAQVARYGGDEFAVFLDVIETEQAVQIADNIRRACISNRLRISDSGEYLGRIGLSIGVSRLRVDDNAQTWFARADQLLYHAKNSGRNCVMVERLLDVAVGAVE